ncbi:hypothetical protein VTN77DRAFT_2513 [Rasamsonia byssochlamydoides]|uniref:uncharacterized protein n=1 Tax=Rasamsonia byssochlamydoides TaxID=89139 RepID=UPI0037440849
MAIISNILLALSLVALARAVPNVTAVLAQGGCSVYPDYDASTGIAGPWIIQVDQCTNMTTSQPCSINGYGDSVEVRRLAGDTGIHEGYITIAYVNDEAKTAIRCNDATGSVLEALTPTGVSGYAWNQINITNIPYSAPLMWGLPPDASIPVEPYYHYIGGVKQPGLFLGSHNVTTWGIKYYEADAGSLDGEPYWFIRLLGPGSADPTTGQALEDGESVTFIRVNGS